jgi:hypothetical protein
MSDADRRGLGGPVRPPVALAFALIGFVALMIFGLGMTSLATDEDVIAAHGLGQFPGILGPIVAAGAFAGATWSAVRRPHPSFWGALWATVAVYLAYLVGVGAGTLFAGADPLLALGVVGRLATSWFGAVVAAAAFVAAWGGIALVRTRTRRPRWPWERDEDE